MSESYFHVGRDKFDNVKIVYPKGVASDICDKVVAWFNRHYIKSVTIDRPFVRVELSDKVSVYASNGGVNTPFRWRLKAQNTMNDMDVVDLVAELEWIRDIDDKTRAAIVEIYYKL